MHKQSGNYKREHVTEFKVGSNEQQIQKKKGLKKQHTVTSTAMAIAKAGGTNSGSIRAFMSPMGTLDLMDESIEDFIKVNQTKRKQKGNRRKS
jgi:hypothetical protein